MVFFSSSSFKFIQIVQVWRGSLFYSGLMIWIAWLKLLSSVFKTAFLPLSYLVWTGTSEIVWLGSVNTLKTEGCEFEFGLFPEPPPLPSPHGWHYWSRLIIYAGMWCDGHVLARQPRLDPAKIPSLFRNGNKLQALFNPPIVTAVNHTK